MPNGDRRPFRIGEGSPSPSHTSDSEDTERHKRRYHQHQVEVTLRWRAAVVRARRERIYVVALLVHRLAGACTSVARCIARFLHGMRARRFQNARAHDRLRPN